MAMKVRFHGQVEWHVPKSPTEAQSEATYCGISLTNANTFSYTFKKVVVEEMCEQCVALGGSDDTESGKSTNPG